jgi:serine/threonine-protein kinase
VDLLKTGHTTLRVETFLARTCDEPPAPVATENHRVWRVTWRGNPFFAKWVETRRYERTLARDAAICAAGLHPAIPRLANRVDTWGGVLLIFEAAPGEALGDPANRRRFFHLPLPRRLDALRALFGAAAAIVDAGWILVDFYEGNVIYDFGTGRAAICDFELYERAPGFVLGLDRNYGSSRLMAPEEFVRGQWIDQATNVYTLGRYAINALSARIDEEWQRDFQGGAALQAVVARATQGERGRRYQRVRAFVEAFEAAAFAPERPVGAAR